MLLNSYLICIRCTGGITIKRTVQSGGADSDGKIHLKLMTNGERFIGCKGKMHGSKGENCHKDAEDKGMFSRGA
jgi:hypothetical protein